MSAKRFKKNDIVKITNDAGDTQIVRVTKVTRNGIVGDSYNYEKDYKREDAASYKIHEKNISIKKKDAEKVEGTMMQSNLRVKVVNNQAGNSSDEEEKIDTSRRGRKRGRASRSKGRKDPQPESEQESKVIKAPDGRRVVTKRGQGNKPPIAEKKSKVILKLEAKDPKDLTEEERQKLERNRIREEKKKERQRKKALKQIDPKPDIELVELNPIIEDEESKRLEEFPLEGCSKFSDNRKFLYYYHQGKSNKKARAELEKLIIKDRTLSNPFQPYSLGLQKDIFDFAVEDGDLKLIDILIKEETKNNKGANQRPTLPAVSLSSVGTGQFNKYQFGFKTRAVSLARGGKEGNNAFTHDNALMNASPSFYNVQSLIEKDTDWKVFQHLIMNKIIYENDLFNYIYLMVRRGNIDLLKSTTKKNGPGLFQKACDNMGYGFNRYHYQALDDDIEGKINKLSMLKRPHTNHMINPLHVACINPNITCLRKYYLANPEYSAADDEQRKLIHYAAANPTNAALEFLISKGIPANDKDMKMMTPLMIACELGRTENVEFLVEQQQKAIKALDKKDEDFELMKSSSDFVGTKGPFGNYPIHYAVRSGNFDTVKALVEGAGEDIDLNVKTTAGESPITLACISGSFEIVEYLLDHNVELHETKKQKKSPLIWAAQNGHIHVVSLLLRHGVHPDVHDSSGNTATHYAAGYGWLNVMKFLIENGAHPDLKNDWNSSPAMIAMLKNHFGCLDYLMELEDVDKSMVDNEGRSVISQLCMNYNPDTLEQIKYMDKFKNLDYCSRDANGWTCLHFLVANSADMYKLQQNIAEREKARKKELEKKLGIKKSNLQPHSIYATKVKHTKRSSKRPAYTSAMEVDGEPEEEQDDDHKELNSIREYFDQSLVKHREMLVEERERFEDGMLECVEHIYSKGLKEDVLSYENESIISIAISSGNFKVAIWMINKLCDGDVPKEVFNNSQSNDNNQNNSCLSFFFDLVNTSQGMKYEPLIELFTKRCSNEQLEMILKQKRGMKNPIMHHLACQPTNRYNDPNNPIGEYEKENFMNYLHILLGIAKQCDFEISSPIEFDKAQAYNLPNATQEEVNKFFEEVNEEKYDEMVNDFGLLNLDSGDHPVYLDPDCGINEYQCRDVKSNLLHTLVQTIGATAGYNDDEDEYDDY